MDFTPSQSSKDLLFEVQRTKSLQGLDIHRHIGAQCIEGCSQDTIDHGGSSQENSRPT